MTIAPGNPLQKHSAFFVVDPWKVVLLHDGLHSFDEVVIQLVKTAELALPKASEIALEAHAAGEAVCYTGPKDRCEYVGSVLGEIGLNFRIERAFS